MRVLVTGGGGFIGSHLVDRFLADGFEVRILDNFDPKVHPHGPPPYLPPQAEVIRGDVCDPQALRAALQDVDYVSHQAAYQDYLPDFSRFMRVNAEGTALIYELIVRDRLPVKKVIVASSQAVYGEGQYECAQHGFFLPVPRGHERLQAGDWEVHCPDCGLPARPQLLSEQHSNPYNQYAVSKLAEERIALGLGWLYQIPSVALRYSITQGPRQSLFNQYSGICRIFVSRAKKGLPLIIYEDGMQTRDFVHVQDLVEAHMLVLQKEQADFQAFNVGSGIRRSVLEYAQLVRERVGAEVECLVAGEYRRGDNRHSVSGIDKLAALGWAPRRSLATILDDFISWVDSLGGIPESLADAHAHMQGLGVVMKAGSAG